MFDNVVQKPRLQRYRDLLEIAAGQARSETAWGRPGIKLHVEGGRALKGDVQDLVHKGYLALVRVPYADGWVSDVKNPYKLRYTNAEITPKGREYLDILRK